MRKFKNTWTLLLFIFAATMLHAQVEGEKEKTEDEKNTSGWDNIIELSNEDYESVVFGDCIAGDCDNGYGKRKKSNETFEGDFKNGKLNGRGTYIHITSEITTILDGFSKIKYVGEWEENIKVGQGVETKYNADNKIVYKYDGSWENDKKNGLGKEYVDGALAYEGKFKNNFRIKESGCIHGDCENGYGVFIYPNKNKYIGAYKNGLRNGIGIETDPGGNYIYGNWKDNKENGYVRIFNKTNEIMFSGEMMSGKPVQKVVATGEDYGCTIGNCVDGFGHYYFEGGGKYIGEWKDGQQHGFGTTMWTDGSMHAGQYNEGEFDGYGIEYDANGQIRKAGKYIGSSFVGKAHSSEERGKCIVGNCGSGFGIFVIALESEWKRGYAETKNDFELKYEGVWISELKNEIGFLEDMNGNTYVGQLKMDEYEGQGVATFANGDMYNGSFEDGAMSGYGTMTYADGSKYVGEWNYNDKEGEGEEYDSNGKLIYSGNFYKNERDD